MKNLFFFYFLILICFFNQGSANIQNKIILKIENEIITNYEIKINFNYASSRWR